MVDPGQIRGASSPPGSTSIPINPNLISVGWPATIAATDWLVDGLLGTGLSRPVEGPMCAMIELMNSSGKPILDP